MTKRLYSDDQEIEELHRLEFTREMAYSRDFTIPITQRIDRLLSYKRRLEGHLFYAMGTDLEIMYKSRYAAVSIQKHSLKFDLRMRIAKCPL